MYVFNVFELFLLQNGLISIPVTNTSVNPARSISQALFVQGWAIEQLWLFIVAPIVGAILAGFVYKMISAEKE